MTTNEQLTKDELSLLAQAIEDGYTPVGKALRCLDAASARVEAAERDIEFWKNTFNKVVAASESEAAALRDKEAAANARAEAAEQGVLFWQQAAKNAESECQTLRSRVAELETALNESEESALNNSRCLELSIQREEAANARAEAAEADNAALRAEVAEQKLVEWHTKEDAFLRAENATLHAAGLATAHQANDTIARIEAEAAALRRQYDDVLHEYASRGLRINALERELACALARAEAAEKR